MSGKIGLNRNQIQSLANLVAEGYDLQKLTAGWHIDHQRLHAIIFPPPEAQARDGKLPLDKILKLKAEGWTNAKIARHFGVSEGTIRRAQKHENSIINVEPTDGQHPAHPGYGNPEDGQFCDYISTAQHLKREQSLKTLDKQAALSADLEARKQRTTIILNRLKKRLGGSVTLAEACRYLSGQAVAWKDESWLDFFIDKNFPNKSRQITIDQVLSQIESKPEKLVFTGSVKIY